MKKNPTKIINEALGIPDAINMVVDIYTDMIIDALSHVINNDLYDEKPIDATNYGIYNAKYSEFTLDSKQTWEYLKNSPKFNKEKWEEFPTYRNKFDINFITLPNEVFTKQNKKSPQIGATHSFNPKKFKIRELKTMGKVFDISSYEIDINMNEDNFDNIESIRQKLSSVISHEIFHSYQLFSRYVSKNEVGFGKESATNFLQNVLKDDIGPTWNNFLYCLYLSLRFEHQARIPQVYYDIKNMDIKDYDSFINAIKQTDVWDEIQTLRSFNANDFMRELSKIESFEDIILGPIRFMKMEENVRNWNEFTKIVRNQLVSKGMTIEPIRKMSNNLLGNPYNFFKFWEKFFHQRADELYRKIVKIYDKVKKDGE